MQYLINQDSENRLPRVRCFTLDMDGTVYLSSRWIDGAKEFLHRIEETDRRLYFLVNDSSENARCYFEKLADIGLPIQPQQLVTSGHAAVAYLKKHHPGKKVPLLGNPQLCEEFILFGISPEENHPNLVVAAFDTPLTYAKMCRAYDFVRTGLSYLSTHLDLNCPIEIGFVPDSGAIHAFTHVPTGHWPDGITGKLNRAITNFMLEQTDSLPEEIAMVGDRLYVDIAARVNNGLIGILMFSGRAASKDIDRPDVHPDLIFDSVEGMIPFL